MRASLLLLVLAAGCVGTPAADVPAPSVDAADAWLAQQWGEAVELVLLEETIAVASAPARQGGVTTPGDRLVLPGTDRFEVTLTWPAGPGAPEEVLLLYDAPDTQGGPSSEIARSGEPVVFVGADVADAAFQAHTHWWFGVYPPEGAPPFAATPVTLRAVAHRAAALPDLAPAPPSDAPMIEGSAARQRVGPVCIACEGGSWTSAPGGARVTNATALVRATLTWSGDTPMPGVVAWTPVADVIEMESVGGGVWEVAPPAEALDNEHQTKSLWWFFLTGGGHVVSGEATLRVEALPHLAIG